MTCVHLLPRSFVSWLKVSHLLVNVQGGFSRMCMHMSDLKNMFAQVGLTCGLRSRVAGSSPSTCGKSDGVGASLPDGGIA